MKNPAEGRYKRCSKMTSLIGITEDSTRSAIRKNNTPKVIKRLRFKKNNDIKTKKIIIFKDNITGNSQMLFEMGKS